MNVSQEPYSQSGNPLSIPFVTRECTRTLKAYINDVHIMLGFFYPLPLSVRTIYTVGPHIWGIFDPSLLCGRHIWKPPFSPSQRFRHLHLLFPRLQGGKSLEAKKDKMVCQRMTLLSDHCAILASLTLSKCPQVPASRFSLLSLSWNCLQSSRWLDCGGGGARRGGFFHVGSPVDWF